MGKRTTGNRGTAPHADSPARTPAVGGNPTTAPTDKTTAVDVTLRGALADTRGARGRARAVRDAARNGAAISEAVLAGWPPVHLHQIGLFPDGFQQGGGSR